MTARGPQRRPLSSPANAPRLGDTVCADAPLEDRPVTDRLTKTDERLRMDELELGLPRQFPARADEDAERVEPDVIRQETPGDLPDEALPPPVDRNNVPVTEGEEPPII